MAYNVAMWNYGTTDKQKTGKIGEDIAVKWLLDNDFSIIDRNIRFEHGELDVVCEKRGVTHFVEVKSAECTITQTSEGYTTNARIRPEENMTTHKLEKMLRSVETYLVSNEVGEWQVDLMAIYMDPQKKIAKCEFFENVSF